MAWGSFQTAVAASSDGNNATTGALNTTGRDWAAVWVAKFGTGTATVSDSNGHTWNALTQRAVGTSAGGRWHWALLTSVGAGHTFTVSGSGIFPSIGVITASGAHATPFDLESAGGGGDSLTSATPGSMTPSNNDSLIIAGLCCYNGSPTAVDGGFTGAFQAKTANGMGLSVAYLAQVGSPVSANPAFTIDSSSAATAAGAVFRPAAGGGGGAAGPLVGGKLLQSILRGRLVRRG